jgi:hypothetical protein
VPMMRRALLGQRPSHAARRMTQPAIPESRCVRACDSTAHRTHMV